MRKPVIAAPVIVAPGIVAPGIIAAFVCFSTVPTFAADWLTRRSTYTHSPETGQRVSQYEPIALPQAAAVAPIRTSGYTHLRSSINYGQSADNYHRVEQWGDPVRPYGEWRFPNRPYSVPYSQWGPPFAGFGANIQSNFNAFGGRGAGGGQPNVGATPYVPGVPPGGYFGRPAVPGRPDLGPAPLYRSGPGQTLPNPYPRTPRDPSPVVPYADGYHPVYRD